MRVELVLNFVLFLTSYADTDKDKKKNTKLPACGACTNLVASFDKGLERTKRGKFDGGDTAWEEKTQPSYATSEVRFIEITDDLCKDAERGEFQCHQNHNEWEDYIETWWKMDLETRPSLRQFLCVETLKACCPVEHYGPECKPCSLQGTNGKLCSGNGKCKGSGTRKGNGQCSCDKEYSGAACDTCSIGHYSSYKDESTQMCSACHKACADHCTGPGPKSCAKCADGYQMNSEHGCMDIDECLVSVPCTKDKFCVNTEGTFRCLKCDKSCDGCDGDGPDNCETCAEGFSEKKNVCVSDNPNSGKLFNMDNTRYITYAGLVVATAIIFNRNWIIASVIGGVVSVYISFTEYYLANNALSGDLQPKLDPSSMDLSSILGGQGGPGGPGQ